MAANFLDTADAAVANAPTVSTPTVKIDNVSDAFATVVSVEFEQHQAELLETITALKNLGLNIRRAKLAKKGGVETSNVNVFYITDATTSEKIVKSARLEEIRLTVLSSLAFMDGSSGGFRASAPSTEDVKPLGYRRAVVQTTIEVSEALNAACSVLKITTRDRPGLLVDIVQVLKDINLNVVSAEVDTIGNLVKDEFFITYHGEPLNTPMVTLVTNALQYYLSLGEVAKEESY
ncbi:MAG: hypothetical protein WDW36_005319 [Sanguina aurantia]